MAVAARYARLRPVLLASFSNLTLVARLRRAEKMFLSIGLQYTTVGCFGAQDEPRWRARLILDAEGNALVKSNS
jgi:hypothetical protein